ncbi:CGNR zinc finger domain-containing protein [Dactylosporangium salmoneum]|uniref:CGNR zinc finger domain-containing protein n=1 Tax=Dactylosporangium salmoneum TaxID=53361 RepID=UPI0031E34EBF
MVRLVNTGPEAGEGELLDSVARLRDFIAEAQVTEVRPPTGADLAALHELRRRLYSVFAASTMADAVLRVNEILAAAPIQPRLTTHDGRPPHLHFFPPYATLTDHLAADCAMALSLLIADGERARLRICAAEDCSRVLYDESRNRTRLYCDSQRCGNRLHAAAYRARRRSV